MQEQAIKIWSIDPAIGIISFRSKMNTASQAVLTAIVDALPAAQKQYKALVIYPDQGDHFCVGADLREFKQLCAAEDWSGLSRAITCFQTATQAIRTSQIPIVAAVKGLVLGGGCELMLHCARVVAHTNTRIGLVETGVGLIPAAGGCKEAVLRASAQVSKVDYVQSLVPFFKQIVLGEISRDAHEAIKHGWLLASDIVVTDSDALLATAIAQAKQLAEHYQPALMSPALPLLGQVGYEVLLNYFKQWRQEQSLTEYDEYLATQIAKLLTLSSEAQTSVTEHEFLASELALFVTLAKNPSTQARIHHILETGKRLRN